MVFWLQDRLILYVDINVSYAASIVSFTFKLKGTWSFESLVSPYMGICAINSRKTPEMYILWLAAKSRIISESEWPSISRQRLFNQVFCIIIWVAIKHVHTTTHT
jgi:hypothetical protein